MRYLTKILILTACLIVLSGVAAACDCGTNECKTPGYWKNHPEAWPVDCIKIGGVTYSKEKAIEIMQMPVKGDKTYNMFDALVAAKLNVKSGCPSCEINSTITGANSWMKENKLGSGVKASSDAWQDKFKCYPSGEDMFQMLDAYNNGQL